MDFERYTHADRFLDQALSFLLENEAQNSLMLGLALRSRQQKQEIRGWLGRRKGEVRFAVFQTLPHNLILTTAPDLSAVSAFARTVDLRAENFRGLVGPVLETTALKEAIESPHERYHLSARQRIYSCEKVRPPPPGDGLMEWARPEQTELLTDWMFAFCQEAVPHDGQTREGVANALKPRFGLQEVALWVQNGEPRALACLSRPTPNGITVNYVYTPPALRGRGAATKLVAALTEHVLKRDKSMAVLYTDLDNPTSNSIYQKIGYRAVADSIHFVRLP